MAWSWTVESYWPTGDTAATESAGRLIDVARFLERERIDRGLRVVVRPALDDRQTATVDDLLRKRGNR